MGKPKDNLQSGKDLFDQLKSVKTKGACNKYLLHKIISLLPTIDANYLCERPSPNSEQDNRGKKSRKLKTKYFPQTVFSMFANFYESREIK